MMSAIRAIWAAIKKAAEKISQRIWPKYRRTTDDSDLIQALDETQIASEDWHEDRLEWISQALRSLTLVNAGGAIAVAAYIGARGNIPINDGPLLTSLWSFSFGLLAMIVYPIYRFTWAEYRVWHIRFHRRRYRMWKT